MKTIRKAVLLTAGFALIALSCKEIKKETPEEPAENPEPEIVKAPEGIIPLKKAAAIYGNYSENRVPIIKRYEESRSHSEDFVATRFIDFDYDSMKQYLAFIDQEAAKGGVKKVTKLRVYLAEYGLEGSKYPRKNTVFFVPTMDMNGENVGFFINEDGKAAPINSVTQAYQKEMGANAGNTKKSYAGLMPNFSLNTSLQGGQSLAKNDGSNAPPPNADF